MHDITHKDGSRSIQVHTPCGFEIVLMRTVEGNLRQSVYFNGSPINLANSHYRLSKDGALLYADKIKEIFNG